jgi:DNA polymerase III delta subunit
MNRSEIFPEETEIKGDSREVIAAYYDGRLLQLKKELNKLTLEYPNRILRICRMIKAIKNRKLNY